LTDFFKYAFNGSGADNFFDAGSCIDGRLTSAVSILNIILKFNLINNKNFLYLNNKNFNNNEILIILKSFIIIIIYIILKIFKKKKKKS